MYKGRRRLLLLVCVENNTGLGGHEMALYKILSIHGGKIESGGDDWWRAQRDQKLPVDSLTRKDNSVAAQ
jgi:hypothetical protein